MGAGSCGFRKGGSGRRVACALPPAGAGRRRRAFTLVELLVVIAILAALAMMIVPAIGIVRRRAMDGRCSANLRSLQTAMVAFCAEHRMKTTGPDFAGTDYWVSDVHREVWWGEKGRENIRRGELWPYVQHCEPFLCPVFEEVCRAPPRGAEWRPGVPYGRAYHDWVHQPETLNLETFQPVRSYSLNEYIGRTDKTLFTLEPGERIWLCDENPWRQLYLQDDLEGWTAAYGINNAHLGWSDAPGEYHDGFANCAFGDGHVEMCRPMRVHLNIAD
jgi:prepilin-type N-terminal cleavage/methylation domain-containing protein/prepilin-type processing-associated H-X9-DG protein